MDPATTAALIGLGGQMMGGKQLGGIAPPFQPGANSPVGRGFPGLLSDQQDFLSKIAAMTPPTSGLNLLADLTNDEPLEVKGGPDPTPPAVLPDGDISEVRPTPLARSQSLEKEPGLFGQFAQNLESGFTPGNLLGMGLLGNLTNRNIAPYGLLAQALFKTMRNR